MGVVWVAPLQPLRTEPGMHRGAKMCGRQTEHLVMFITLLALMLQPAGTNEPACRHA